MMTIFQSVFDVGSSLKDINLQALKLHQIKQNIERVEKKIDKMMINPLIVANQKYKTAINEIKAGRFEDTQRSFLVVIDKASEALANLEYKSLDMETFKLCVHALKLIMCSTIAKYCYNSMTKSFLPYTNLSISDQKLIAQELEELSKKCLALKENVKVRPTMFTSNKQKISNKEESQNILDKFQQASYPYISNGFGWTRNDKKITTSKVKIQVKNSYLPNGEEDKSCLHIGVLGQDLITVHIWVTKQKLYIQYKGSTVFATKIDTGPDLMEVEFGISAVVVSSSGGVAQHRGWYLGQYNYAGEHNGRPYYIQLRTFGSRDPRYLYSDDDNNNCHWYIDTILGNTKNYDLCNPVASDAPPATGWKYEIAGKLNDDPTLKISPGVLQPCDVITVKLSGEFLRKYPEYAGEYRHNGDYYEGVGVYTNNSKLLYYKYLGSWNFGDAAGDFGRIRSMDGDVCKLNCPAKTFMWISGVRTDTTGFKITCNTDHQNKQD